MGQSKSCIADSQAMAQWEWKSNPNPYSQCGKAQWTPFKPLDNFLLEKAFRNQQNEVDIGDYVISIKDMLQRRKDDAFRKRPVRRNTQVILNQNSEEYLRSKRFFGVEIPKPYNDAFGDLQDYLKFFQNRGPDISEFVRQLEDIEALDNLNPLNKAILPSLVDCIQNESKKISIMTNTQEQYEKQLLLLFQGPFKSIKQFYSNVLLAYTMEGFLYSNLNRYLRNEDWNQLDSLLPYAYCLCKAFLRSEFATSSISNSSMTVYRGAHFDEMSLSQYDINLIKNFCWSGATSTSRNRQIAENCMYRNLDPKKNAVMFIIEVPLNAENLPSKWIDIKSYSVIPSEDEIVFPPGSMFELSEISKNTIQNTAEINLKLITNAHQGRIMQSEMTNNRSLKLVHLEGKELLEALFNLKENRLIEELEFYLCKFDEKVGVDFAQTLEKMPQTKSLVFISPSLASKSQVSHWSSIFEHLKRLPIEKLEIVEPNIGSQQFSFLTEALRSLTSLTSIALNFRDWKEMTDEDLNHLSSQNLKQLTSLKSLTLDLTNCSQITDTNLNHLCSQGLKYLTSLTSLTLNFNSCAQITEKGLSQLAFEGIKPLILLTSLNLDFSFCDQIHDEGLENFSCQGLSNLTSLKFLSLGFAFCPLLTDQAINNLLRMTNLSTLRALTLNFYGSHQISDQGLNYMNFQKLTKLTSLVLDLGGLRQITHEGLINLCSQGLKHLNSLKSLNLNLSSCNRVSDEWLKVLSQQGLKYLTSLTSLTLDFQGQNEITDNGFEFLSRDGLQHLNLLTSLSLNFSFSVQVTDEMFNILCQQGLNHLLSLTSLSLRFSCCTKITDQGLNLLIDQGIKKLSFLTSLALDFSGISGIPSQVKQNLQSFLKFYHATTIYDGEPWDSLSFARKVEDDTKPATTDPQEKLKNFPCRSDCQNLIIKALSFDAFSSLDSLKSLVIDLHHQRFTNEALENFCVSSIKNLTSLKELSLDLSGTLLEDQGLYSLTSQGLKYLVSLTSLALNLSGFNNITEEGLDYLSTEGLKNLSLLKALNLNLENCPFVTDEGIGNLLRQGISLTSLTLSVGGKLGSFSMLNDKIYSEGLRYLTSLTSLTLNFGSNYKIAEEGLKNLSSQGLKYLTSLTSLTLNIRDCTWITDEGLNQFSSQGLKYLTSLTSLTLNFPTIPKLDYFEYHAEITDQGLRNLSSNGLKYLTSLSSLVLNFQCHGQITENGLNYLLSNLKHLNSLTSLSLDFSGCKIGEGRLVNFKHLASLQTFSLYLQGCFRIPDEWLNNLSSELKCLASLRSLNLSFKYCNKITEEGLNSLNSQGIKYLTSLESFVLQIDGCNKIHSEALRNFRKVLRCLGFECSKYDEIQ